MTREQCTRGAKIVNENLALRNGSCQLHRERAKLSSPAATDRWGLLLPASTSWSRRASSSVESWVGDGRARLTRLRTTAAREQRQAARQVQAQRSLRWAHEARAGVTTPRPRRARRDARAPADAALPARPPR